MEDLNCLMTQTSTSVADLTPFANTLHLYIPPCLRTLAALNRCETCFNWVWILQLTQHNFACTWTVQDTWSIYIVHPESPWTKDASGRSNFFASGRLIFCAQTHADARWHRRMHTDEHRRMQIFSAAFFVQSAICLGLEPLSPPILVPCW